jgi:hypothetical protein
LCTAARHAHTIIWPDHADAGDLPTLDLCRGAGGRKQVVLGGLMHVYNKATLVLASVDLPVIGSVIGRSDPPVRPNPFHPLNGASISFA